MHGPPPCPLLSASRLPAAPSKAVGLRVRVWRRYQQVLDLLSPLLVPRWVVAVLYLVLYCLRAFTIQVGGAGSGRTGVSTR